MLEEAKPLAKANNTDVRISAWHAKVVPVGVVDLEVVKRIIL